MATTINMPRDPNTLSNYNNWTTRHTKAELAVDFETQRLTGNVTLDLESITESESEEIVLDSSYLDVTDISLNGVKIKDWVVKDRFEPYGSPLSIKIPGGKPKSEIVSVNIALSTTSQCTALQWLTPAQTKGKYPYMFSQCQAIHNRSLFPWQDTPDVKSTYEFIISSPLPVIASGVPVSLSDAADKEPAKSEPNKYGEDTKTYHFIQKIPMTSYLFALASGDIVTAPIGPRSVVATTPGKDLADAKWELERDMEKFIEVAEALIFPYVWGQYNVLVLPASFPYGI
jgi:leukotriene-A4 hydrolase